MAIISDSEARDVAGAEASDTMVPLLRPLVQKALEEWIGWPVERATYTRFYPQHHKGAASEYFPGVHGVVPSGGGNTTLIMLHHKFVLLSGLQVWEYAGAWFGQATAFSSDHLLTLGSHYAVNTEDGTVSESGHVHRLGAYWPKQPGSVRVTYTAGFTDDELDGSGGNVDASDIRYAMMLQFQKSYAEAKTWQKESGVTGAVGPKTMESVPGYTYTQNVSVAASLTGMNIDLAPEVQMMLNKYRRYEL